MDPFKEKILIVEDEEIARKRMQRTLKQEGYDVFSVNNGLKALHLLESKPFDLVITDLKMEQVDGMQVLRKSKKIQPHTEVILVTGYATLSSAVEAMRKGAYHYLAKPFKIDELRKITQEALLKRRLYLENLELKASLKQAQGVPFIVGKSDSIKSVLETLRQIAPSDINVMVLGESGTGKELVARAIHTMSARSENRFVAFNCGSFTEELMTNELFGHEKDAFTGATKDKPGLIEVADGGTLFLDEIGDMPHSMQVKLLRVIQEKEVLRVGGLTPISVDVRFISATHRELKEEIENGRIRQDLCYRLNVITIDLPPLRDRDGDIPLLAHHFLMQKNEKMKKNIDEIDREAMDLLCQYSWPGNVRELENIIERAVALGNGPAISVECLPDYIRNLSIETYRQPSSTIPTLMDQERHYIKWILGKARGNKTQAAKIMGIDRVSLWRKLKRHGLE